LAYTFHRLLTYVCCRIVSYFVVFLKHGFSPSDLQRAQKAGGEFPLRTRRTFLLTELVYTQFSSAIPVLISSTITDRPLMQRHRWKLSLRHSRSVSVAYDAVVRPAEPGDAVYLGIFIMQCFNVYAVKARFAVRILLTLVLRHLIFIFSVPIWSSHGLQPVQLRWNLCGSLSGHVYHLYPASACGVWRLLPPFAFVLVDPMRLWHTAPSVGLVPSCLAKERHAGVSGKGYSGPHDV
jgi:hypothetical protein